MLDTALIPLDVLSCSPVITERLPTTSLVLPNPMSKRSYKRYFEESSDNDSCDIQAKFKSDPPPILLAQMGQEDRVMLPHKDDDLATIAAKMQNLANIVRQGGTLNQTRQYPTESASSRNPLKQAKYQMLPEELWQYEAWENNKCLPVPDWDLLTVGPVIPRRKTKRSVQYRKEALRRMYPEAKITDDILNRFTSHYAALVPLVKAITKVVEAERATDQDQKGKAEKPDFDVYTAAIVTAQSVVTRACTQQRQLTKRIGASKDLLQEYIRAKEAEQKADMLLAEVMKEREDRAQFGDHIRD